MAKSMRIRTDDQVVVIGGKDAGKTGRVVRTEPKRSRVYVEGLNMVKRHERPRSVRTTSEARQARRDRREGGADPRLQRDAARPQRQQADPGRRAPRQRRQARAASRSGAGAIDLMEATATPDLAGRAAAAPARALRAGGPAGADQEIRLLDADAGAAPARRSPSTWGSATAKQNNKMLEAAQEQLATIAGQQPERAPRPQVDRLLQGARGDAGRRLGDAAPGPDVGVPRPPDSIAVPRIRDFRGLNPRSFDGRGNYSMGVKEQLIFPEIDYDSIDEVRGLDITITTTAADRPRGLRAAARAGHAVRPGGPARAGRRRRGGGRGRRGAAQRGGPPARPRPSRPRSSS